MLIAKRNSRGRYRTLRVEASGHGDFKVTFNRSPGDDQRSIFINEEDARSLARYLTKQIGYELTYEAVGYYNSWDVLKRGSDSVVAFFNNTHPNSQQAAEAEAHRLNRTESEDQ